MENKEERKEIILDENIKFIKVSGHSSINTTSRVIVKMFEEKGYAKIRSIGAAALNQSIKSIIVARGTLARMGIDVVAVPYFSNIEIDGTETSAIDIKIIKLSEE